MSWPELTLATIGVVIAAAGVIGALYILMIDFIPERWRL